MRSAMRLRHRACLLVLAACGLAASALLVGAPAAHGATTIGSDLSGTPAAGCVIWPNQYLCTLTQLTSTSGASLALTAPSDGVITQIRLKHGSVGSTGNSVGFRILTPAAGSNEFTARIASPSGTQGTFATSTFAAIDTFGFEDGYGCRRGVAIHTGEQLGIYMGSPDLSVVSASGAEAGEYANENHYQGTHAYTSRAGELLLQATIEPDANGDGYGDETQAPNCGGVVDTDDNVGPSIPAPGPTGPKKKGKKKNRKRSLRFFYGLFSTYVPGAWTPQEGVTSTGAKGQAVSIGANHVWLWHGKRGHWGQTGESDYPLVLRNAVDGHDWKVGKAVGASSCKRSQIVLWDGYTWYCGRRVQLR